MLLGSPPQTSSNVRDAANPSRLGMSANRQWTDVGIGVAVSTAADFLGRSEPAFATTKNTPGRGLWH